MKDEYFYKILVYLHIGVFINFSSYNILINDIFGMDEFILDEIEHIIGKKVNI